jgi:hypothetical protein
MLGIAKHIKLLSSLAALMFTLGSSGVAVVIHSCTMAPQMECCENMNGDMSYADAAGRTDAGPTFQSDMSCTTSTLVGGLTTNPGVVENNVPVQKISVVVAPAVGCPCIHTATRVASVLPFAESISPPSVPLHILNASLLI